MRTAIVLFLVSVALVACSSSATNPAELGAPNASGDAGPDAGACGVLASGASLHAGDRLSSCDGGVFVQMQGDGNLALYGASGVLWAEGQPGVVAATMRVDGALVLVDAVGNVIWSSGTSSIGAHLTVTDDGHVVIFSPDSGAIWSAPP